MEYGWCVDFDNGNTGYSLLMGTWRFKPGHEEQRRIDDMQHALGIMDRQAGDKGYQFIDGVDVRMSHTAHSITWTFSFDFDLANVSSFEVNIWQDGQHDFWETPALGAS